MSKEDQIGALWKKEGKYGDFFTGKIEFMGREIKIVVSKSQYYEEGGKKPYFIIKLDTYEPRGQDYTAPPRGKPEASERAPGKDKPVDDFTDDIPF